MGETHGAQAHAVGQPRVHIWPQEGPRPSRDPRLCWIPQDLGFLSGNMALSARQRVSEGHVGAEGGPADLPSHPAPFYEIRKLRTMERIQYLWSCTQPSSWGTCGLFLKILEAAFSWVCNKHIVKEAQVWLQLTH